MKKIGISEKGKTWLGSLIESPELDRLARRVVEHFRWRGPMEIELRHVEGRGFVIFEINPRLPAWLAWTAGTAGGMIRQFYQLLVGEDVQPVERRSGVVGVRINRFVTYPVTRLLSMSVDAPGSRGP